MPTIQRTIELRVEHFNLGAYIEYSWFRGTVCGLNANKLTQYVRVQEVLRPGLHRTIGAIQPVPFNHGREVSKPECRNVRRTHNPATNEDRKYLDTLAAQVVHENVGSE